MKRKKIAILLCIMSTLFCSGCGGKMEKMQFSISDEQLQSEENRHTEGVDDIEEKSEAESIQESIDMADPSLNDVFKKFEGQWIFDEERGACVGIERTETCAYGVEGSNWTVWVTGGDIISDLDIYGYTRNSILFKIPHDGYDAFYELSFNLANSINFAFGTSLDAMDEVIVCD
ncbi:MAG: hypothetical protein K2H52_09295 [Lachnospiraceae bacterium]|nr:hypothetical protein [Lachnospiraceae bacterium]MDE6184430.1 hypothetical protein [Lachnospiraceae bacterium]